MHMRTNAYSRQSVKIQNLWSVQEIEQLVQRTRPENLKSILEYGLLGRKQVEEWRSQIGVGRVRWFTTKLAWTGIPMPLVFRQVYPIT